MSNTNASKVLELFGNSTRMDSGWKQVVKRQWCPFANTRCFKVRKSDPGVSIGTCSVCYGKDQRNVIICPNRFLERRQVFMDCLHLLTQHDPGNELHVVPEVSIPGGSVDYFVVSVTKGKVKDFVAVEFQTLDTTGTVWPERQRLLRSLGIKVRNKDVESGKPFGMNWKMTAKTILVQLHHKVDTLEHIGKHFVLVLQDCLLDYLRGQFNFAHLKDVRVGDVMHIHSYKLEQEGREFQLHLDSRLSTDAAGVAQCLGIQANTKVELEAIIAELERKISAKTALSIDTPIASVGEMPTD
jgi:Restriction endonuclease NotI